MSMKAAVWCFWGMLALRSSIRVGALRNNIFTASSRRLGSSHRFPLAVQASQRLFPCGSGRQHLLFQQPFLSSTRLSAKKATKTNSRASSTKARSSKSTSRPFRLLIVESPSKCDTIAKILEKYVKDNDLPYDFRVSSCMGHVRNLPKNKEDDNSPTPTKFPYAIRGIDLEHDYKPTYIILPGKEAIVSELRSLASQAEKVLLATDPDREGEAMAWHLTEILNGDTDMERISFSEITPSAIIEAVSSPIGLNPHLVAAQETRRVLDRLAGYTVSPVLWRKIAPGLSAGRVQSVGLDLIVKRERERLNFEPTNYASVKGTFVLQQHETEPNITATLHSINGKTVASSGKDFASQGQKLRLESEHKIHLQLPDAEQLAETLSSATWKVLKVESKEHRQQAPVAYKTSTLQQDAVRRLGLSVQQSMRVAQQLYEKGLISYMRTDSTHLSVDAEAAVAQAVTEQYGADQVVNPAEKKSKKKKSSKFAQEAHEAIRPAIQPDGTFLSPTLMSELSEPLFNLYNMIYKRSLASRMPPLVSNQTQVVIEGVCGDTTANFRTSGSVVISPGYKAAYGGKDDEEDQSLPPLLPGQPLGSASLDPKEHSSQPPSRFTEASFVKELESLGVGRPSTYAGTVQTLRDRAYVGNPTPNKPTRQNGKVISGPAISAVRAAGGEEFTGGSGGARAPMVPSLSAFVVCSLLEKHCPTYVDPDFTARMEERLDAIASGGDDVDESWGEEQRVRYLNEFYAGDSGLAAQIKRIDDTVQAEDARRADLPALSVDAEEMDGKIGLFVGPWGPYIQERVSTAENSTDEKPATASLPPGMAADLSTISPGVLKALLSTKVDGGVLIGTHPDDGRNIRLKTGRFGAYLQWGDDGDEKTTTHSLPRHKTNMRGIDTVEAGEGDASLSTMLGITLEEAVGYVGLPRTVCAKDDLPITAAIGPYGPYLKYNNSFVSLNEKDGDVLTVDAETAVRLVVDGIINGKKKGQGVIAELGEKEGSQVSVKNGRFGVYLNWKRVNAKLPTQYSDNPAGIPLDEAWGLIQEKAGAPPRKKKGSRGGSDDDSDLPPAPKRPLSAYLHFCAAKRPKVAETVKSLGEVSKKLSEMWAATPEGDRAEYNEMAAAGKAAYEAEKQKWKLKCDEIKKAGRTTKKRKSTTGLPPPKRPLSAYLFFCSAHRPEVSQRIQKLGDISKELARMWAEQKDRTEFERLAAGDKERYEEEMKTYNGETESTTKTTLKSSSSVKLKKTRSNAKKTTTANKAKARGPSGYMLFCKEFRPSMVDANGEKLPFGETTKQLAKMWKESDEATKNKFRDRASAEKEKLVAMA